MEMDSAQRRLQIINGHLHQVRTREEDDDGEQQQQQSLAMHRTAGEFFITDGYSAVLPEKLRTGEWNVYRNVDYPLELLERYDDYPDVATLHDNIENAVKVFTNYKSLGTRERKEDGTLGEYKWLTYGEVGSKRCAIGSALVRHGIPKGASVGLYMINRPEWVITELACASYSFISVPLYDTLGADSVQYVITHAEIIAVFLTQDKLEVLLSCLSDLPGIKLIVVVQDDEASTPALPKIAGVEIIAFTELEADGYANPQPFVPPEAEDVATLCYTSGTTGTPKGVMLTHRNLISNSVGVIKGQGGTPQDVHASYLPLAHIYERMIVITLIHVGGGVGFFSGDILRLLDDLDALKPTLFSSVPRLYNRIHDQVMTAVRGSGMIKKWLFHVAYKAKKDALQKGTTASPIWDHLVFNKIRALLGGRTRLMTSGASPLSPDVLDFLRICFGCQVSEGYGLTETACVAAFTPGDDLTTGHVGCPTVSCEIKLKDVPEMEYTSRDKPNPRGEICIRGPIVFKGYYNDEVQTREILDDEGWLHTGDVGMWLPGGKLKIIDRKKNIFKLAQGEYIAPEKIENVYARCQFIAQIFVYGDSFNSSLVAIAVVDPEVLQPWAKSMGIKHHDDLKKLCQDPVVNEAVLADMDEVARVAQLRGFEFVKAIFLDPEQFTIENNLLTPSLKVKRPTARQHFAQAISDMYSQLQAKERSRRPISKSRNEIMKLSKSSI